LECKYIAFILIKKHLRYFFLAKIQFFNVSLKFKRTIHLPTYIKLFLFHRNIKLLIIKKISTLIQISFFFWNVYIENSFSQLKNTAKEKSGIIHQLTDNRTLVTVK